ncbi:FecR family protein [Mucilaginibacter defluvii]|uniref:FecR family protein n=1 Tax=Mucilaginibacter defluvii TaxID=1196019 RepID=A0ABP9FUX7_9SPHI|nr:DUF4974 domain-containing protein [Bacteroidota bacterium]
MQNEQQQLEALFQKYRQGMVTEEEKALIARWLIRLDVIGQLTDEQLAAKEELSKGELKRHFFSENTRSAKVVRFPLWVRSVAASLLIVASIAGMVYFGSQKQDADDVQPAYSQLSTQTGEIKTVTLTDGTKITLNSESRLKYPTELTGKTREVFLTGEAYFDVAHDPGKPFKVHTDKLDVQVLGTSFDVKAYGDDGELSVTVSSGKVGVLPLNLQTKAYMLLPGDRLVYRRSKNNIDQLKTDVAGIGIWQKGRFNFREETLQNIARQLERYYKVRIIFKNPSLQQKQISLKVKNHSINTVIKALSIAGEFRYEIKNSEITVW